MINTKDKADTKVILHSHRALPDCKNNHVLLRSPSAETDILVLAIALLHEFKERIVLDNWTGNSRQLIWMGSFDFSVDRRNSLLGFHSFIGNDFVS